MNKKNKGFTLTETLLTITILVILFALAVPGVFSIKKNLRQMELDDKAEIIYTAVQNRLSELYTSGLSNLYDPVNNNFVTKLNAVPGDFDESKGEIINKNSIYYFKNDVADINKLLGDNTIDPSLTGHFVVEYIPYVMYVDGETPTLTVPFVYGVYYSEDEIDVTIDYGNNNSYVNDYRSKERRLNATNARVGYYGGSTPGSGSSTKSLTINTVKIYSEEEINTAVVKGRIDPGIDINKVLFRFEFKDEHNNIVNYYCEPSSFDTSPNGLVYYKKDGYDVKLSNNYEASRNGNNYTFKFTIDDLSSDATRFHSLFNDLSEGDDITLTAYCTSDIGTVESGKNSDVGNSIFAYKKDKENNTVYISNGRHLQNLDNSSELSDSITSAKLLNDIDLGSGSDFATTYKNYFNQDIAIYEITNAEKINTTSVPCFRGITKNDNFSLLEGNNHTIKGLTAKTGLFNTIDTKFTIQNLSLTGERIYGNDVAGGLIANIGSSGNVTINKCSTYLVKNEDIPTSISSKSNLESVRWIYAKTVGGLVGYNEGVLNIESSFVATTVGLGTEDKNSGETLGVTGGLVGKVGSSSLTNINKSYADCYLYGKKVGGLIGGNEQIYENNQFILGSINIKNSYSAGFIATDKKASSYSAGLVSGYVNSIKNSYTVISKGTLDYTRSAIIGYPGITTSDLNDESYYNSTVASYGVWEDVYFKTKAHILNGANWGIECKDFKKLNLSAVLPEFSFNGNPHPYGLMGTSLTSYNYPKLKDIEHYGDWGADFVAGSLVYYEKYSDGRFGFDGANVDISLTTKKDILGDGYGIVFKTSDINPDANFTYVINGNKKTINFNDAAKYVSGEYTIYPLGVDEINPNKAINDFYQKCDVYVGDDTANTKSFYFNPHFGRSVVEGNEMPSLPKIVYIRSPRHLNNLSLYYSGYRYLGNDVTYKQERKMNYTLYEWSIFGKNNQAVNSQSPIGEMEANSFIGTYDGGSYEINNVNFNTNDGSYIGLFGYNNGNIKNVVVATQYEKSGNSYNVTRNEAISSNQKAYFGVLVGYNNGNVDNCAIAGYYLAGHDGKIYGYRNSKVYVGGLVGYNSNNGSIKNSAADLPKLSLVMNSATSFAGSFVGYNEGFINNTYGISLIGANSPEGNTKIAGFAGYNTGTINNSYCATTLISSGNGSYTYRFTPSEGSGIVKNSYYLNGGSFQYIDDLYSYDSDIGDIPKSSGTPKSYYELISLKENSEAKNSKYHDLTTALDKNETTYPYRAIVKDNNGQLVHYGEWQATPELGVAGVFYWEHEIDGTNNGYKITYIGSSNGKIAFRSNLCIEHDDGGVISEYGYGYYCGKGESITATFDNLSVSKGKYNETVKQDLESQIPYIEFYPFTTTTETSGDYIYLDGANGEPNGKITLTQGDDTYLFTISPFFANAISFDTTLTTNDANAQQFLNKPIGYEQNPYEIRSAKHLQYINWNFKTKNDITLANNDKNSDAYRDNFTYLMSAKSTNSNDITTANYDRNKNKYYIFVQSHDINAENIKDFVPIAGQAKSNVGGYAADLTNWFGGTYNGQSYKIQELSIKSDCFTVGLFGVTCGANLENIILYSTKGATIERNAQYKSDNSTKGAYALGGLVGVAYDYKEGTTNKINNCAIAGYKIIDNSENEIDLGEANVGGLVGISKIKIDKCSAVVDIEINCTHRKGSPDSAFTQPTWGNYIRVGGISGAGLGEISNSYTGGTMKVGEATLDENFNSNWSIQYKKDTVGGTADKNHSTNIYLAGIIGNSFCINFRNITGLANEITPQDIKITNCYTYMTFPSMEGTIRSITMFGSVADRYSNTNKNTIINNSYYLDRSANFDISNLPKFIVNDGGANRTPYDVMHDGANGEQLRQSMLLGSVEWLYKMHTNKNGNGWVKFVGNYGAKTYRELSDTTMNATLNSAVFNDVTCLDDSGNIVDGKYSFSSGNPSLTNKNYPFPTVIRQSEYRGFVYVHYGTWPLESAYFEKGSDVIDIFDNMENDGFAYKEFILKASGLNITNLNFSVSDSEYVSLVELEGSKVYTKDENGDYHIKLKALKTGATDVTATWENEDGVSLSTSFNLVITANLNINATPNEIYMNNGDAVSIKLGEIGNNGNHYLEAISTNGKVYSNSENLTWSFESSKYGLDDNDAFTINNISAKEISIKSNDGVNGYVLANATYKYGENNYIVNTKINIYNEYILGLHGDTYSEISIRNDDINNPKNTSIYLSLVRNSFDNVYFIYERNDNNGIKDLINNVTCTVKNGDEDITSNINVVLSDIDTDAVYNNEFNFRTIILSYKENSSEIYNNVVLTISVDYQGQTYSLDVPVTLKRVLTLNANGGSIGGANYKTIELNQGDTVQLANYKPDPRVGYNFVGWFNENDVQVTEYSDFNSITLSAKWDAYKGSITFDYGLAEETSTLTLNECYYGLTKMVLPDVLKNKDSYKLDGYYDQDGIKILDADGNVVDQETYNDYVLSNVKYGTNITLKAKWIESVKLTLRYTFIDEEGEKMKESTILYPKGTNLPYVSIPDFNAKDNYSFEGFIDDANKIIIKSDGNVDNYVLNDDLTLYALFKTDGYLKTDSFENNVNHLIVSDVVNEDGSITSYAMSGETPTNGNYRKHIQINKSIDINSIPFIKTDNLNIGWLYTNGLLKSKYVTNGNDNLYGGLGNGYYLTTSGKSQIWTYDSANQVLSTNNKSVWLDLNNGFGYNNQGKIDIYKYSNNILVKTYERNSTGGGE